MNRTDWTWRTVDIVVAAAIAIAFGVVFWAWNQVWAAATPAFVAVPPAQNILYGVWLVPAVLAGLIIRKPGAALFTELVAASVSAILGSQWGLDAVGAPLAWGVTRGAGVDHEHEPPVGGCPAGFDDGRGRGCRGHRSLLAGRGARCKLDRKVRLT